MAASSPEDAIQALLDTIKKAWQAGDGELFASVFTEDADFVNIRAHELRGRAAIAEHHNQIFSTVYQGSSIRSEGVRIKLIRPDVATIEQTSVVEFGGVERRAHMLAVAVDGAGGWAMQAVHNMIPFDGPPPASAS